MKNGKIVQVMGPVVDVLFPDEDVPKIKDALIVDNHGKKCLMEVSSHQGGNIVRCIMLTASEGLSRDMEVVATGDGIKVPVGEALKMKSTGLYTESLLSSRIRVRLLRYLRRV